MGTAAVDTADPDRCVTTSSVQKNEVWCLDDVGGFGGSAVCNYVNNQMSPTGADRAFGTMAGAQVGFLDGHAAGMKSSQWYWHWTPWLNPALGGGSASSQRPRMPDGY